MDALRLTNLRSLRDTGFVGLKPLTVLVGQNSSGKSTFLRSLPLLRQSVEAQTEGPILWYGSYVDFGGFDDALRDGADTDIIGTDFKFKLAAPQTRRRAYRSSVLGHRGVLHDLDVECSLRLARAEKDKSISRPVSVEFRIEDHNIRLAFDEDGKVQEFVVNERDVLSFDCHFHSQAAGDFIPIVGRVERPEPPTQSTSHGRRLHLIPNILFNALKPEFHGLTKDSKIWKIANQLGIGSTEAMVRDIRNTSGPKTWRQNVSELSATDCKLRRIRDIVIADACGALLISADNYITQFARGIRYIGPVRAQAQRYYRPQSLAVKEVNPRGDNLAVFLRSLDVSERRSFQEWTNQHFGLVVKATTKGEHLSLTLTESESGPDYNLADVGFGFSQLIPVLAQLWAIQSGSRVGRGFSRRVTYAIEQPELHLHPSLQAKLADVFLGALDAARSNNIDLRLIIESHSETIINRIGDRIAEEPSQREKAQVVVFEREKATLTKLRISEYDEEGFLSNWPYGFFDPDSIGVG